MANAATLACACVALTAITGGCAPGPVSFAPESIIGGFDDYDDPSVVLLFGQDPGSTTGSLCTGTVVSPHVILTAAHCVGGEGTAAGQYTVFFGSDFATQQQNGWQVREVHFDAAFDPNNLRGGHDIGVAVLYDVAPVAPLPYNRSPIANNVVGAQVRLVGYGLSDGTARTGSGTKRWTTTTLASFDSALLNFDDPNHQTCNGDSGGPAFIDFGAGEVVAGVTSFGDANCLRGGSHTRVDVLTGFVDGWIDAFDPGVPPTDPMPGDPSPTPAPSTRPPSSPRPTTGDPTIPTPTRVPSGVDAQGATGDVCETDNDCASHQCGASAGGTKACLAGSLHAGCAVAGGGTTDLGPALGLLLLLVPRRRRRP